jgi:hypothetical protein
MARRSQKYRKRRAQTRKNKRVKRGGVKLPKLVARLITNNTTNMASPTQYRRDKGINCDVFIKNPDQFAIGTPIPGDFDSYWIAYRNDQIPTFVGNDSRCEIFYNLGTVTSWKCESFKTEKSLSDCKLYLNYFTFVSGNKIAFKADDRCPDGDPRKNPCNVEFYNDIIPEKNPNIWGPKFTFYKYIG